MSARLKGAAVVGAAVFFASAGHHHGHGGAMALNESAARMNGSYSAASWARAFLKRGGFRPTACDIRAVQAWQGAEGTYGSLLNPLDSTQREPGSYSVNPVGVQHYASWSQGLHASVVTLFNGRYPAVISALRAGDDAQSVADAVAGSPWGTGRFSATC